MRIKGYWKRRKWFWLISLSLIALINLLARSPSWVERYYTSNFYYIVSIILRSLFGWMPFSFGDVLYFAGGCWMLYVVVRYIKLLFRRKLKRRLLFNKLLGLFYVTIVMYITFNILWGLNYDGVSITGKLNLGRADYDTSSIISIQKILIQRVNEKKQALIKGKITYPSNDELFTRAKNCYDNAAKLFPFIRYRSSSIKSSFYGFLGNYLGFTGYYNPFSGEAQVNTTIPKFLLPYITTHEIAHQLGFAKEDEANFVGYLASISSVDTLFQYSAYLDLFLYANREVYYFDSTLAKDAVASLVPGVKADLEEWRKFNLEHTSFLEPAISWMYGKYLQLNKQPEGLRSYNKVVAMLIAYHKKYETI